MYFSLTNMNNYLINNKMNRFCRNIFLVGKKSKTKSWYFLETDPQHWMEGTKYGITY